MKALSIKNPISYLVCAGVKDVENRSWPTNHRGRLLIHSSGLYDWYYVNPELYPRNMLKRWHERSDDKYTKAIDAMLDRERKWYGAKNLLDLDAMLNRADIMKETPFCAVSAIIGEVTLADVKKNSKSPFAARGYYHWILTDAVLYDKPILAVSGKLGLWNYDL